MEIAFCPSCGRTHAVSVPFSPDQCAGRGSLMSDTPKGQQASKGEVKFLAYLTMALFFIVATSIAASMPIKRGEQL